jgi:hypothetical protein
MCSRLHISEESYVSEYAEIAYTVKKPYFFKHIFYIPYKTSVGNHGGRPIPTSMVQEREISLSNDMKTAIKALSTVDGTCLYL